MRKRKKQDSNPQTLANNRKFFITCYSRTCEDMFDVKNLVCCTKCRQCFHPSLPNKYRCNDPPLVYDVVIRYPWHCNRCKVCVNCDDPKDGTLIICDACDRAFHLDCTREKLEEVPDGNWYCYDCQYCKLCYKRLSDTEAKADRYSLEGNKMCRKCLDQRTIDEKNLNIKICCVCSRIIDSRSILGNGRITCSKCTQGDKYTGSHTKCSRREKGYRNNPQILNWICNNCQKIESWKTAID